MSELRSEWTPQQVQENLSKANESLPEARPTDRFPLAGRSSGMDFRAGEEQYEEDPAAAAMSSIELQIPPDPPRRPAGQGDQ